MNPTNSVKSQCKSPTQRRLAPGTRQVVLSCHLKMPLDFEDATRCMDLTFLEWLPRDYTLTFLFWHQF